MESVTSTVLTPRATTPAINRPNSVAVGTIVWLGSEVMFFAGLFAIYFTLRSTGPFCDPVPTSPTCSATATE